MTFTAEQLKALEPYEQHFTIAIRSKYARFPGLNGVQLIHSIYSSVVKNTPRLNASCPSCIFRLLTECGQMYFKDKEEMVLAAKPKRKKK